MKIEFISRGLMSMVMCGWSSKDDSLYVTVFAFCLRILVYQSSVPHFVDNRLPK